ncbi:MAG TPA: M6 family metalloprotease domain-containing protein, partial [Bacteroidales bacterium]|nr:M6 family metalloprotease domain-containing protein [Bacteroidales bacterium]
MKKTFIFVTSLLVGILIQLSANAVPAKPGIIEFSQPDGTSLKIYLHGDERIKWATSLDGYTLIYNSEGYYEYAELDVNYDLIPSGIVAKDIENRTVSENNYLSGVSKNLFYSPNQVLIMNQIWDIYDAEAKNGAKAFPTTGNRKLVCILIGFTDKAFVKTQADFNSLFNQVGYTTGGATGSVKDYYLENSYNQFNLTVDVAGPYTAANNMAYYGANDGSGNDLRPRELVTEAVTLADPAVNYADYDNDLNGTVDGVYVIYAGYGEEAGGPATAIWAHAWAIPTVVKDGKSISSYSCSAELRGNSGTNITRIGVICHEFGHVLGAPDYYDTDYATNGQYDGTGGWDMMAGGSWNNNGATPAHHNAYTKIYVYGWASAITISTDQNVALLNSVQNSESFYRYNTTTSNEYFLVENRQQIGFDSYIPGHGMLIYHVDGSYIASNSYSINASSHQGMFPMAANASTTNGVMTGDGAVSTSGCPWPGTSSKTTFTDATTPNSKSWASANTAKPITNITEASGIVQFCFISCPPACTPPTTQATNFSATDIGDNQMTIGWTRGNGDNVLVVGRKASAVDANPVNGITYTADASFGAGMEIGTGNYVVYKGASDNVVVTDLIPGSVYHFAIYEFFTADNCYSIPALKGNETTTGIVPSYCDTLSQFCCTPTIYTSTNGYVGGTNEYSCLGVAEFFQDPSPYNQVSGARIYLAAANNGTSPNVTFVLWDNENGGPTNQMATSVIPLATVVTAYNNDGYIDIDFGDTFDIPAGGFSVGFLVPGTPASGDTLALVTNADGEGEDTGYCLFGTSWASYNSAGWGITLQNAIFPFACFQNDLPPVAGFVGNPVRIPLGSTVQFTDLSSGTTPTSWAWTFEGGYPDIETDPNPLITYNTLGFFDVSLEVSNTNGSDIMTKTDYIEVFDPNGITAFSLDFEACSDFQLDDFDPWTTLDVDGSATYSSSGFDFLNEEYTGSFIAFNSNN